VCVRESVCASERECVCERQEERETEGPRVRSKVPGFRERESACV